MKSEVRLTDPDPFNHGTTTIELSPIELGSPEGLNISHLLSVGWNQKVTGIESVERVPVGLVHGRRNFRVQTEEGDYLFRESRQIDPKLQQIIFDTLDYLSAQGALVIPPTPTTEGKLVFNQEGIDFSLSRYLVSEHFDGSQAELIHTASAIAILHKAMELLPHRGELKERGGKIPSHDKNILTQLAPHIAKMLQHPNSELEVLIASSFQHLHDISDQIHRKAKEIKTQPIHHDLHPHNILFDPFTQAALAIIDFEELCHERLTNDIVFAMHRFSRTYGAQTERKQDIGVNVWDRASLFLDEYLKMNPLPDEDISSLSWVLLDECLWRVCYVLNQRYLVNGHMDDEEILKQFTVLQEALSFNL